MNELEQRVENLEKRLDDMYNLVGQCITCVEKLSGHVGIVIARLEFVKEHVKALEKGEENDASNKGE